MNEVGQAAERLRQVPKGEFLTGQQLDDVMTLADAYLRLTDETAIDEAWLRSVGFGEPTINGWPILFENNGCDPIDLYLDYEGFAALIQSNTEDHVLIGKATKTRGDLRLLAMALGIELQEPTT